MDLFFYQIPCFYKVFSGDIVDQQAVLARLLINSRVLATNKGLVDQHC
jgi:hypothetical protein